ncbi:MAG: hypothetical protein ABSH48_04940 [Verrucomicrobiota bacterium]|jgi:Spy/CpxP family protein refolding chaperone
MKLNKTLMIAGLIAGTMFWANVAMQAQDTSNTSNTPPARARNPGARGGINFDYVATQLALTDDQKTKARPVFEEMGQKLADLRKDQSVSPTDRRAKVKEIRDDMTAKLKDILTQAQFDQWQKMGTRRRPAGNTNAPAGGTTAPPAPGGATSQQ